MKRNSRLSLALHSLCHMAKEPSRYWTSDEIASHAGTNPVVVRRVLGKLSKAEILNAKKGHSGGWQLAKTSNNISLGDVYQALDESFIASSQRDDAPSCSVENALQQKVHCVLDDIELVLVERLRQTSIADVAGV